MSRVLVIGDLHAPATNEDYLLFVKRIQKKHKTSKTVFIGDIIDHEAISFHAKNPELPSALDEYSQAIRIVKAWHRSFPNALVCIGNHDIRVNRIAKKEGIPSMYLLPFNDVYGTFGWDWKFEHTIDGVLYTHGTDWGGKTPAFSSAQAARLSIVCGHFHSIAGINYHFNGNDTIFGMNVGCGVDMNHPTYSYSKHALKRPVLSCGVVIDGHPYLERM